MSHCSEVVFIALCPAFGLEADWRGTRGSCHGALSEHPGCCKDELFRPSRSTDVSEMAGRDEGIRCAGDLIYGHCWRHTLDFSVT